jgi:tetratricopeptide (TPR) repeat protein
MSTFPLCRVQAGARFSTRRFLPIGRVSAALAVIASLLIAPSTSDAQRRQPPQEFVQQTIIVPNFHSSNRKLGAQAGEAMRDRVGKGVSRRQLEVVPHDVFREKLTRAGFRDDTVFALVQMQALARDLRADEYLVGEVERDGDDYLLSARLVMVRDIHVSVPFGPVVERTLSRAADRIAEMVREERAQLPHLRRCENAAREGQTEEALSQASSAIAELKSAPLIRLCRMRVLLAAKAAPERILADARVILQRDSTNPYAIEATARASDAQNNKREAAAHWVRLARFAPDSLDLIEYVLNSMISFGHSRPAASVAVESTERWPHSTRLRQLRWQIHIANEEWDAAVPVGERLMAEDDAAQRDSTFYVRYAQALRMVGRDVKALEIASRGVTNFPGDGRIFLIYTQLVRGESRTALSRGLGTFPDVAEFRVIQAQELKSQGRQMEALQATASAMQLDSTIARGFLQLAQAYIDVDMADSAYSALRRGLAVGENPMMVSQIAFAGGGNLYRAAAATDDTARLGTAVRLLSLADSAASTAETRIFSGAAALALARLTIAEAGSQRSCSAAQRTASLLTSARSSFQAVEGDGAAQVASQMEYLGAMEPVASRAITMFCAAGSASSSAPGSGN